MFSTISQSHMIDNILASYPDDGSERVGERRTAEAAGCSVAAALWRTAA